MAPPALYFGSSCHLVSLDFGHVAKCVCVQFVKYICPIYKKYSVLKLGSNSFQEFCSLCRVTEQKILIVHLVHSWSNTLHFTKLFISTFVRGGVWDELLITVKQKFENKNWWFDYSTQDSIKRPKYGKCDCSELFRETGSIKNRRTMCRLLSIDLIS